jgi:hypothetical protein
MSTDSRRSDLFRLLLSAHKNSFDWCSAVAGETKLLIADTLAWCAVVSCACLLVWLLSVVLYLVRAVHKFYGRIVHSRHLSNNKR